MKRVILKLSSITETIQGLISSHKYGKAAAVASHAAADSSAQDLKKIVVILADALAEIGDRHPGRGRPKKSAWDEQNWRLSARISIARGDYALAVIARDLVDDRTVSPHDLAWFFFRFCLMPEGVPDEILIEEQLARSAEIISRDAAGSRAAARPYAEDFLKRLRLGPKTVPRKGFKAIAVERIAENSKLRIDQVRPKRRE